MREDWLTRLERCKPFFSLTDERPSHQQVFAPFLCAIAVPDAVSSSHGALPLIPGTLPSTHHESRRGALFRC
jgi:hypothetical protein